MRLRIQRSLSIALPLFVAIVVGSCGYLDKPRPMKMYCEAGPKNFIEQAAGVFDRNGYTITERRDEDGYLEARDTTYQVLYRYVSLIRTWKVKHTGDTVVIHVSSVSERLDGSDVTQTWDKKWSGDEVKEWMRPIMNSLESVCGLGSPLRPR